MSLVLPQQKSADSYQHATRQLSTMYQTYQESLSFVQRLGLVTTQTARFPTRRYSEFAGLAGFRVEIKRCAEKWEHCLRDIEKVILHAQAVLDRDYRLAAGLPLLQDLENEMQTEEQPKPGQGIPTSATSVSKETARVEYNKAPTPKASTPNESTPKIPTPKPSTPVPVVEIKDSPIGMEDDTDSLFGDHLLNSSGSGTRNPPTPANITVGTPTAIATVLSSSTPQKPSPLAQSLSMPKREAKLDPTKLDNQKVDVTADILTSISSILPLLPPEASSSSNANPATNELLSLSLPAVTNSVDLNATDHLQPTTHPELQDLLDSFASRPESGTIATGNEDVNALLASLGVGGAAMELNDILQLGELANTNTNEGDDINLDFGGMDWDQFMKNIGQDDSRSNET